MDQIITSYKIRPVVIHDEEVGQMLNDHLFDLTKGKKIARNMLLDEARAIIVKRIFANHLKFDIICLQEANYLDESIFSENYEVIFGSNSHSVNGVAWNTDRFSLLADLGEVQGRGNVVKLLDKSNSKIVLVASGHLTGCNPYRINNNDSIRGDKELKAILTLFDVIEADIKVIGMDSNVASLHPRLEILKNANFLMDYENFLDPTCTNPWQVLNTRIDWIAVQDGRPL